jgi:signal recognition particle GTPase
MKLEQVGKLGGIQGVMSRLPAIMRPQNMPGGHEQSPLGDANLLRVRAAADQRHLATDATPQAFEAMAAQMSASEKLNPKNVTAARKNELCVASGTSPVLYNRMVGMHLDARAAFKSWCSTL